MFVCCSAGDGSETLLLLGLMAVLVLVLRRRAALRTLYGPPPGPLPGDSSTAVFCSHSPGSHPGYWSHAHRRPQSQRCGCLPGFL